MQWTDAAKLAAAFAVPMAAVAGMFYMMMNASLSPIAGDLRELRGDVHALDVRMARLEERMTALAERLPDQQVLIPNATVAESP